ncbi:hypothetical protein CONPUDRAFT_160640 [Coniophora puteana RWD-64-598 SS2]|uniref:Uncharacterized protein n=1 Tax=Coniophora puteana (strain RWD-64-598) TaxID=741705 RepID=R7SDB1_CONPW|nr:uncharacterized protein CONPUDRAFT_160640 [Coniophora puteana RWD-64-598 SS2]EIW73850.1 hypothetical protein CONPUDRAFT_160640 [Coniophora puteana RWD-64-598 SS2]
MPQIPAIHPDADAPPRSPPWSSVAGHPAPTTAAEAQRFVDRLHHRLGLQVQLFPMFPSDIWSGGLGAELDDTFATLAYIYAHTPACGGDWDIKLPPSIEWLRTEEDPAAMVETWVRDEEKMTRLLDYQTASGLDVDDHGGDEWWEEVFRLYHVSSSRSQGSQRMDHVHVPLVEGINLKRKRPRANTDEQAGKAQKTAEGSTSADGRSKRTRKPTERAAGGEGGGEGSRKASGGQGGRGGKGGKGSKGGKGGKGGKGTGGGSAKGKEKGPPPPPMPSDEEPPETIFVGADRCGQCRTHDQARCIQVNNQACTWCKAKKTKCNIPKSHNATRPQSNATAARYRLGSAPSKKATPAKPSGTSTSASAVAGPSGSVTYRPPVEPPKKREYIELDSDSDVEYVPKTPASDSGDKDADGETDREEEDGEQPEEADAIDQAQLDAADAAEVDAQLLTLARLTDALARR